MLLKSFYSKINEEIDGDDSATLALRKHAEISRDNNIPAHSDTLKVQQVKYKSGNSTDSNNKDFEDILQLCLHIIY